MTPEALLWSAVISFSASFFGVLFALWYESLAHPRLLIGVDPRSEGMRAAGFEAIFLKLRATNRPRTIFGRRLPFLRRQSARLSHGSLTFSNPDAGQTATVAVRWDAQPEPLPFRGETPDGERFLIPRYDLIRQGRYIDIPPDESEAFAAAVRVRGEDQAYGWSGENYNHPRWHNEASELPPGEYYLDVRLVTDDFVFRDRFQITVGEEYDEFELTA